MCHVHACKELGAGFIALRRFPCNCKECDRVIRLPWDSSKSKQDQPRFQSVPGCRFASILGDLNGWFVKEIKEDKKALMEISKKRSSLKKRKELLQQSGGYLGTLLGKTKNHML